MAVTSCAWRPLSSDPRIRAASHDCRKPSTRELRGGQVLSSFVSSGGMIFRGGLACVLHCVICDEIVVRRRNFGHPRLTIFADIKRGRRRRRTDIPIKVRRRIMEIVANRPDRCSIENVNSFFMVVPWVGFPEKR